MAKRINKAIELLEQGQPLYPTGAGELSYQAGKGMAGTWADYINLEMEHEPFDMKGLEAFMQGLVDGGPTASGPVWVTSSEWDVAAPADKQAPGSYGGDRRTSTSASRTRGL